MANVEIKDITTQKTTFTGSEFLPGQESGGGVNSSFKGTLDNIDT